MNALRAPGPMSAQNAAFPALDDLGATIDVDFGARASQHGKSRMSEIERMVLVPLLQRLHVQLAPLRSGRPSRDWIPLLQAADDEVAAAERTLASD